MTTWDSNREKNGTKSRDYTLGSFLSSILTILTDPKDGKGLKIKTDPAYAKATQWKGRKESKVTYKSRFKS